MKSEHLRVIVKRNGSETVNLTMPIYSLKIIDTVMPDGVLEKLKARNIDIKELIQKAKDSDYAPQDLFEEEAQDGEDTKSYKVWIE